MCKTEKDFPSPLVNAMVLYLNENHPLPDKTVVCRPLKQINKYVGSIKAGASIYKSRRDPSILVADICVGTAKSPASDYVQMRRIAHEYRHALQTYRDGKVYNFPLDEELEKDAWEFAHFACNDMMKDAKKYLAPLFKARN